MEKVINDINLVYSLLNWVINTSLAFEGVTYLISNLASNTTYLLRVASKNPAGLSDWTTPLEVKTHAREPFGLPPSGTSAELVATSTALLVLTAVISQLSQITLCNQWANDIRWMRKSLI